MFRGGVQKPNLLFEGALNERFNVPGKAILPLPERL
jgi:hypothetical protein